MNKQIFNMLQVIVIAIGIMLLTLGTFYMMDSKPMGMIGIIIGFGLIGLVYLDHTLSGVDFDE